MGFNRYTPCTALQPYVRAFAIAETVQAGTYSVLPGTGLVLGFQYQGRVSQIVNDYATPLTAAGLTGLHDRYKIFHNTADTGTVLVYLTEIGTTAFFQPPANEFFRESVALDTLLPHSEVAAVAEKLQEALTAVEKIRFIEQFLLSRLRPIATDDLVVAALQLIHRNNGNLRIRELAKQLHISQSPLEKRFRHWVGTSPKKFASIVRFRHLINDYQRQRSLTDLGYAAGFYDQAHFVKDFRNFTGQSPEEFFAAR